MLKQLFIVPLILLSLVSSGQKQAAAKDVAAIKDVLARQTSAWNKGDIDAFMEGYWKSDSILFIGSKITHGWNNTLERYKKSYPGKAAMGILKFEILKIDFISADGYLITGKFHLTREKDSPEGIFTLLFERKEGKWVIVYDHTSSK